MEKTSQSGFSIIEALIVLAVVSIVGSVGWYMYHAKATGNKSHTMSNSSAPKKSVANADTQPSTKTTTTPTSASKTSSGPTNSVPISQACGGANDTCTAPFTVAAKAECNGATDSTCVLHQVPTQNRFASYPPSSTAVFYGPAQTNGSSPTYFTYAISCSLNQCGEENGGPTSGQHFTTSQTTSHVTIDFTSGTNTNEDVTMQASPSYVYTDTSQTPSIHTVKHFKNWVVSLTNSINFSEYQVYAAYGNVCSYTDGQAACSQ